MSQLPEESDHKPPAEREEVTVHYAKTHLSRLLREVATGAEYIIARGDTPVARLVPIHQPGAQREFGALRDSLVMPAEFLAPLSSAELDAWDGV
jgi:prevent-host-death family protein